MFAGNINLQMYKAFNVLLFMALFVNLRAQRTWYRVDDPESKYCFFIDSAGNKSAIGQQFKSKTLEEFYDGLVSINFGKGTDQNKWGCLNDKGDTIIKGQFYGPIRFFNGVACVPVNSDFENDPGLCKFINTSGLAISDKEFSCGISSFEEGFNWVVAKSGNHWYILSKSGKLKELSVDYESVEQFSDGYAKCNRKNHYTEYIDTTGWPVLDIPNENYTGDFKEGLAIYSNIKGKYGFMNKKGQSVSPCIYDAVSDFSEGLAAVKIYDKWGFIDTKGKMVIKPLYDKTEGFYGGMAMVKVEGKYGFINRKGDVVIPLRFSNSMSFSHGFAALCDENNLWGYMDITGKWVIKPQFIEAENFDKNGYALVNYTDKFSYKKGKLVTYEKALIYRNGKVIWNSGEKLFVK